MYNINNINKYFFYGSIGGFGFSYLYLREDDLRSPVGKL